MANTTISQLLAVASAEADAVVAADNAAGTQTQKVSLGQIAALASAAALVKSVAGRTGDVLLDSGDVGLGNVNNTSDAAKPISDATQAALDAMLAALAGKAESAHAHGNINADGTLNSTVLGAVGGPVVFGSTLGDIARGQFGSGAGQFCQGDDPRLSDARTPAGAAGGALAGAFPDPQIAAGAVVTAGLADAAVTTAKIADAAVTLAKTTGVQKSITSGTAAPTGGTDGDIYLQYT